MSAEQPDSQKRADARDVRARGFAARTPVQTALDWIDRQVEPLPAETVSLAEAPARVLAGEITSPRDVPAFDRAMMDGFALRGDPTQGAGVYHPLVLRVVGTALAGQPFARGLQPGQAVRIMTGAPLPAGADAVLPFEQSDYSGDELRVVGEVPPGKNVGRRGEDVTAGSVVLRRGRVLRPQDVGVIASLGLAGVAVVRRPQVKIVVAGDELVPAGEPAAEHQIYDANGPMLQALVIRDGGIPITGPIVPDREDALLAAMRDRSADVVLVAGGSSVGQEDHAPVLLRRHGELAIHGLAMRPSSPAGMGRLEAALVFLLPGNPASCLCAYDFFAGRAIRGLCGRPAAWPYRSVKLPLARKISSQVGRLDYARVAIASRMVEPLSVGGASILTSTTRADGFVVVPEGSEGYPPGAEVEVFLYDAL
ncbi:MAG: molybdopterin molybdotransferase MoeA [Planctomycetia bacterium]|nr:molybdopterin molybdotransferase MoeA [Planctomycetia bacterium]